MGASLSTEVKSGPVRARRARRGAQPRRWVREVQGIAALAIAAFVFVALAVFDPAVPPGHQAALVGPVGIWLAWGVFRSFGYAAFLFPLMAAVWGVSAFVRPLPTRPNRGLAGCRRPVLHCRPSAVPTGTRRTPPTRSCQAHGTHRLA